MPTSHWHYISPILDLVANINERRPVLSVLDVGCGAGKWGFLLRDVLEFYQRGVYYKPAWKTRVVGVEIFKRYSNPVHDWAYDEVHWADVRDVIDTLPDFDVILAMEVIEHLQKSDGLALLDKLVRKARRGLIMSFPPEVDALGRHVLEQKQSHGNPAEEHVSVWTRPDVEPYRAREIAPLTFFMEGPTRTLQPSSSTEITVREDALVLTGPGSSLEYELPVCHHLEIVVLEHPWSACLVVENEAGDVLREVNLFSEKGTNQSVRLEFAPARSPARIVLRVAPNALSRGNEAWIRAVMVK